MMMQKKYYQQRESSMYDKEVTLEGALFDAMYELFTQIGVFWQNSPEEEDLKEQLYTFMINRISLDANYLREYKNAKEVLDAFKQEYDTLEKAYASFFTDPQGLQNPPESRLAYARQKVSNEFISFQLSVGGFKAFGAENYPSYINGAYIEGQPAPYRTK